MGHYIEQCKTKGEVVIIGDINCHFGTDIDSRFWGKSTPNAKKMLQEIYKQNLAVVDGQHMCDGPNYTFHVEGVGTSYVDHCIASPGALSCINKCSVLEDCIINTSDHLPITITITASITECETSSKQCRIAWHKLTEHEIVEKYTTPLEQCINTEFEKLLQNPDCIVRETQAIDDYTDRLTQCMARSSDALRKDSKSIHTKPYWNASLTALSKHTKSTWHAWCDKGRPRGNDELFLQYKEAKKQFRQERKQTEREYEHRNIQKLCDAQDMDQSYFWFLV